MFVEVLVSAAAGAFGGLVRAIVTGKGLIPLPRVEVKNQHRFLNLGFITPVIIGVGAGVIAPYTLGVDAAIAFLAGYAGTDFIENALEYKIRGF